MSRQKLRIGIDIDDVLCNFMGPFLNFYNTQKGTNFTLHHLFDYHMTALTKDKHEISKEVGAFRRTKLFRQLSTVRGSVPGTYSLLKAGHELYGVSGRSADLQKDTEHWIKAHFPGRLSGVHLTNQFSRDGVRKTKAQVMRELSIDLLIEDSLDNAVAVAREGFKVVLPNYPWNRSLSPEYIGWDCDGGSYKKNITRVDGWPEISERILSYSF